MRKGFLYIIIATLAFGCMNLTVKTLSDMHPMQVVGLRAFGTFVFIFPYMLHQGISVVGKRPGWLLLRGIVGVISLATFFLALQQIPLGSAISIRYLAPIFAAVLAVWWLKERVYLGQWACFTLAFLGVVLLKGFDIRIDTSSLLLLLVSAFFLGGVFVLIRFLGSKDHYLTIINYFMIVAILSSLLFLPQWRMPQQTEWWSVVSVGVFGMIGQIYMTKAYQLEETNLIAPFKYLELLWGLVFGYLFFTEVYNGMALLGMGLILVGMIGNVWMKQRYGN